MHKEKRNRVMRNRVQCHRAQLLRTAFSHASVNAIFERQVVQKQCPSDTGELEVTQRQRLRDIFEGQEA